MKTLHFLCAGAAQGVMRALQADFEAAHGVKLQGRFGAVGAMKEALLAGEPCELMVSTAAMVEALAAEGRLRADARAPLGRVRTGVAVRSGRLLPDVATPAALTAVLRAASAIYFPDPERATAGIHFARVLRELAIHDELQPRFRTFPNGATAMRELAADASDGAIGCTQVTEILYTEGVVLVGLLPPQFELATAYTAVLSPSASAEAAALLALLGGPATQALRAGAGFEF
ncbi:Molybdate ABC transporter substrate-binding protein [Rubrivivax sp. A210]|uniref:molybdate ABC transporter substrate-binding protein n=1 Tax=Rubrivivax sp. A210 TaxID=2772301 RepID=UPI001918A6C2|nr:substrate-binding domain-containing protein [Rubrivivax sp. A210]CAD5372240.1 Molybdate ABC transporter substrate-binding protein [Rubrivivax sp. A210]